MEAVSIFLALDGPNRVGLIGLQATGKSRDACLSDSSSIRRYHRACVAGSLLDHGGPSGTAMSRIRPCNRTLPQSGLLSSGCPGPSPPLGSVVVPGVKPRSLGKLLDGFLEISAVGVFPEVERIEPFLFSMAECVVPYSSKDGTESS